MKKSIIILLIVGALIISTVGVYFFLFNEKPILKDFLSDATCTSTYLGFCYNQSNPAYGCNIETKTCDVLEFRLVTMIGFMEGEDVKIYGTTWCPVCGKQLDEFGKYGDYLIKNEIFIYCDIDPIDLGCGDVTSVPTWKQRGQIIYIGYLNIQQMISDMNNSDEIQ